MTKQNIGSANIVLTFGDGNGNTIAIAVKSILKNGTFKYELYKTDDALSFFEFLTASTNPYDFDKLLYESTGSKCKKSKVDLLNTKNKASASGGKASKLF